MKNKINFITGETYNLSELFSGERKIIVPDLQRDYCWGDSIHTPEKKELVSGFIKTLLDLFDSPIQQVISLGLIYGYEEPQSHIQLCDGQQRITTLFLLLGVLNKHSGNNAFKHLLISNFEYKYDDREPYLNYAIRESSLYFISDLVCHFFISRASIIDEEEIKDFRDIQSECNHWFFGEYNLDPSIKSMINAIQIIYNELGDRLNDTEWVKRFGDYLAHKLSFLYYDMETRRNGEETFVVINTTGEPLTATQNLKPRVLSARINKDCESVIVEGKKKTLASAWEDIENFFWIYTKEENGNDTGDAGFQEFLRWVVILHNIDKGDSESVSDILATGKYSFDAEQISFYEILEYWQVIKTLFESNEYSVFSKDFLSPREEEIQKGKDKVRALKQIDCFKFLPVVEYCKVHRCDFTSRNTLRLYQFVQNLARLDNVSRAINSLVYHIVDMSKHCDDIIDLLQYDCNKTLFTEEERIKLTLLKNCQNNNEKREEMEEYFWSLQSDRILDGEIINLIKWSIIDDVFDFDTFKMYGGLYQRVFSQNDSLNLLRRSLLTIGLSNYPSDNGKSLCDTPKEWKSLIDTNSDKIKDFLYGLLNQNLHKYLEDMCSSYTGKENPFYDFVKKYYLLDYCDHHHVNYWDGKMMICKRWWAQPFSIENAHLLYELGATWSNNSLDSALQLKDSNWSIWYYVPCNCVVCENKSHNIAIDIAIGEKAGISVFYRNPDGIKETDFHKLDNLIEGGKVEDDRYRIECEKDIIGIKFFLERIMAVLND